MEASKKEIFKLRMKLGKVQKEYSSVIKLLCETLDERDILKLVNSRLRVELEQRYKRLILVQKELFKTQNDNLELRTGLPLSLSKRTGKDCILRVIG